MVPQCVRAPAYRGLTLTERVAAWCRAPSPHPPVRRTGSGPRDGSATGNRSPTSRRDRPSRGGSRRRASPRTSSSPSWVSRARRSTARPPPASVGGRTGTSVGRSSPPDGPAIPLPEGLREHATAGFLVAIEPLLARACDRLRTGHPGVGLGPGRPAVRPRHGRGDPAPPTCRRRCSGCWTGPWCWNSTWPACKACCRATHPRSVSRASCDTSAGPRSSAPCFTNIPVLARQLITALENFVDSSLSFLGRLCADWEAIRAAFSPGTDPGVLVEVAGGVGDKHRGGQSVLIATFGSGLRVVYKPKALGVDVHVQELLAWLNARGDHPPFRTLTVLDRGRYGWVEFVAAAACTSADEVRRFYERQGGYLALLYALEATDFHGENLIAAGEHPVLVDLESLFHPRAGGADLTGPDHARPAGRWPTPCCASACCPSASGAMTSRRGSTSAAWGRTTVN